MCTDFIYNKYTKEKFYGASMIYSVPVNLWSKIFRIIL